MPGMPRRLAPLAVLLAAACGASGDGDGEASGPTFAADIAPIVYGSCTPCHRPGETAPFPYFVDHGDAALVEAVRAGRRAEFTGHDWSGPVADPAAPETFHSAVLDPSIAAEGSHRRLLAWYTELLTIRRSHPVLTDPRSDQDVHLEGDLLVVERRLDDVTSVLLLNFGAAPHPDPASALGTVLTDSDPSGSAAEISPWSARLRLSRADAPSGA